MSKQINHLDHKLTEDERAYLESRGRRHLILINDRLAEDGQFVQRQDRDDDEPSWEDEVMSMTVAELKEELAARDQVATGAKHDLQQRLIQAGPVD